MNAFERVISNNNNAEELLASLNSELNAIKNEKIKKLKSELISENANLLKQVELAKEQLIKLETLNGKTQIPVPGSNNKDVKLVVDDNCSGKTISQPPKQTVDNGKPPKEKKRKQMCPVQQKK